MLPYRATRRSADNSRFSLCNDAYGSRRRPEASGAVQSLILTAGIVVNVARADRLRLEVVVADRNAPQEHVWRTKVILTTADGCCTTEIMGRPCIEWHSFAVGGWRSPETVPPSGNVRTPLESLFGKLGIEFAEFRQIRDEFRIRRLGIFGPDVNGALKRLGTQQLFYKSRAVF